MGDTNNPEDLSEYRAIEMEASRKATYLYTVIPRDYQTMIEETMTPRERWLCVLGRKKPDRLPMDYWATPEVTQTLMSHFGFYDLRDLYESLHIDVPFKAKPRYIGPEIPKNLDVYGCRYRDISYGVGTYRECISHPLKQFNTVEEIERNYSWPHTDLYDYSKISEQVADWWDYPIEGGGSEPFLV